MRRFALGLLVALCLATAASPTLAAPAHSAIETPADQSTVFGVVTVRGWVLDVNPISSVQIIVDGPCAPAVSGCNNAIVAESNIPRPDVIALFPDFASAQPGFQGSFLASQFANGSHTVSVVATEEPANPVTIGSVTVQVVNGIDQAPFGAIDVPTGDPAVVQGANSAFLVSGWALDDREVVSVDILVDGQVVVRANYGAPRPDVQAAFPSVPNSLNSGWSANLDSTSLINGMHTISARATDDQGATSIIGVRSVQVDNASLNLHPFGAVEYPLDESTIPALCAGAPQQTVVCEVSPCFGESGGGVPSGLQVPRSGLNPVSGWVLDTGARQDPGQTAYIQLLIDGVIIADTRQDCVLLGGAFVNCYGVNRPDIEKQFPGFVNSDNAGFVFDFAAVDDGTGHLVIFVPTTSETATGTTINVRSVTTIVPGKHDITVRAGDVAETVSLIGTPLSVNFLPGCVSSTTLDHPAFGAIEVPLPFGFLTGTATVSGWAFDPDGFSCDSANPSSHIDVDVDGHYQDIVTLQSCDPCLPDSGCIVSPNCEPAPPGSNFSNALDRAQWCITRSDVPIRDVRVPSTFSSPTCTDEGAAWTVGNAKVGWSFALDTTLLANSQHDLNVYASDCKGRRTLIGRQKFVVFNDPTRGAIIIPGDAHIAPAVGRHP